MCFLHILESWMECKVPCDINEEFKSCWHWSKFNTIIYHQILKLGEGREPLGHHQEDTCVINSFIHPFIHPWSPIHPPISSSIISRGWKTVNSSLFLWIFFTIIFLKQRTSTKINIGIDTIVLIILNDWTRYPMWALLKLLPMIDPFI